MPAPVLWLALFAGLSPTLLDLARHWIREPWALPSACFVPLWLLAVRGEGGGRRRPGAGLALIGAGLGIAAFAAASGSARFGRFGIPLAVVGLALWIGRPSPARAALAAWWIPMPHVVQTRVFGLLSPLAERLAAGLAEVTGGAPLYAARELLPGIDAVRLGPLDTGLQLVWLLAGLGWYAAVRGGGTARAAAGRALRLGLLGIPLQLLALALAAALAHVASAALARSWLDLVAPIGLAGGLLWLLAERWQDGAVLPRSRWGAGRAG